MSEKKPFIEVIGELTNEFMKKIEHELGVKVYAVCIDCDHAETIVKNEKHMS